MYRVYEAVNAIGEAFIGLTKNDIKYTFEHSKTPALVRIRKMGGVVHLLEEVSGDQEYARMRWAHYIATRPCVNVYGRQHGDRRRQLSESRKTWMEKLGPEGVREYNREYAARNRERIRETNRRHYARNRVQLLERTRARRKAMKKVKNKKT